MGSLRIDFGQVGDDVVWYAVFVEWVGDCVGIGCDLLNVIVVVSGDDVRSAILSLTNFEVLVGIVVSRMAWSIRWLRAVLDWSWCSSLLSGWKAAITVKRSWGGSWYSRWWVGGRT